MRTKMIHRCLGIALTAAIALAGPASAQTAPATASAPPPAAKAEDPGLAPSPVSPALQKLRWEMLNAPMNNLTFRNMDTLFTTRTVAHAGTPWALPRSDKPLDFTYSYDGATYTPEQFLDRTYTNALLVMKDGKIVSEIYRNNSNERTRFMGWSMTKSITSILIGCALAEGRIKSLDEDITAYLPELKGTAYDGVTIRQILEMRTGIDYQERYDITSPDFQPGMPRAALIDYRHRFIDQAIGSKRHAEPGSKFEYNSLNTQVLGRLLQRVSGGSTLSAYMTQRLWEPLGAEADGFFVMDGPSDVGHEFNGAGFNATLRDFGRIGLLMLNNGKANGHQIISPEWIRESTQSRHPDTSERGLGNLGYAYQWWTLPGTQAYSAIGLQGQYIFVDPPSRTVVVKLSYFPPADQAPARETIEFLKAAAAWQPR